MVIALLSDSSLHAVRPQSEESLNPVPFHSDAALFSSTFCLSLSAYTAHTATRSFVPLYFREYIRTTQHLRQTVWVL